MFFIKNIFIINLGFERGVFPRSQGAEDCGYVVQQL